MMMLLWASNKCSFHQSLFVGFCCLCLSFIHFPYVWPDDPIYTYFCNTTLCITENTSEIWVIYWQEPQSSAVFYIRQAPGWLLAQLYWFMCLFNGGLSKTTLMDDELSSFLLSALNEQPLILSTTRWKQNHHFKNVPHHWHFCSFFSKD